MGEILDALIYHPEDGAIAVHDGTAVGNRPLYMHGGIHALIHTGDRPGVRCGGVGTDSGFVGMPGILRNGAVRWAEDFAHCTMRYRPNRTEWTVTDPELPGLVVTCEVLPLAHGFGWVTTGKTAGAKASDRWVWRTPELPGLPDLRIAAAGTSCEVPGAGRCLTLAIEEGIECAALYAESGSVPGTVAEALAAARRRLAEVAGRIVLSSPDPYFDAAAGMVASALDGVYVEDPPAFYHAGDGWRCLFLGWRTMPGATDLGWHDRVKTSIAHYLKMQVQTDTTGERGFTDDRDDVRMSRQLEGSRYFGKGFILQPETERNLYNMQTQFFDGAIHAWRSTGDLDLEALLLPALEFHVEWARACFDPDGDGLYDSYINVIPTDSMQYGGGGTVEESSYQYNARCAAAEMCRRKGDLAGAARHAAEAEHIRTALMDTLYLKKEGHFAAFREQGGHRRIHPDAWLYSEFLPIDHGIPSPHEALSTLHYTEWGLERVPLACGGEMCWNSNWVPQKWSTRWLYGGDNYALAGAYFRTGLGDAGWELVRGNLMQSAFGLKGGGDSISPGGFNFGNGEENLPAVDATDITNAFVPAILDGMFGYRPDYPAGVVRIQPALPSNWDHASLQVPDVTISYRREPDGDSYRVRLARPARLVFRLPIRADRVVAVRVGGLPLDAFQVLPGYGCAILEFECPMTAEADILVELEGRRPQVSDVVESCEVDGRIRLSSAEGPVLEVLDLQGFLADIRIEGGNAEARVGHDCGHAVVLARIGAGDAPYWKVHKLHVRDLAAEAALAAKTPRSAEPGASFRCLDMGGPLDADVRSIYRQKYLSPRPDTVSARIGTDGYSNWTYLAWGKRPPEIGLENLDALTVSGKLQTPPGVPFLPVDPDRNIAFTSLWDNWPDRVCLPVHATAERVWLLVCGTTNCMQGGIESARFRFRYEDGEEETLGLVHPQNFWTLCPTCGIDYDYREGGWPLPAAPPPQVQLGVNCRAMVLSWTLRPGKRLRGIELECLSEDVVVGWMGTTLEGATFPAEESMEGTP